MTRTVGSTTTDFLWDTNASLPLLLDDGTYSYIYGPSSAPIAEINDSTGTVHYLTDDLIGSTRLITSSTGTVDGVNLYDEYGNIEQQTGTATSPMGYSGNWTDPDTGLVYLRARDYDPATAQFLTVDPLVDTTRQPYAYVADNPLTQTDPSGCDFWNDMLNNIAVGLMHGPGADVASLLEGIGDGATFGLTGLVRQAMGTDCEVQKNGFYFAGLIGGGIASSIVTAGLGGVGDAADAGEAADVGEDATESVGEDTADDSEQTCTVGGQSFSADTPVVLANGTSEPIAAVRVGQKVKAVDTRTGKDVIRTVTTLWVKNDTDLLNITVTSSAGVSSTIRTTAHHLFWDVTTSSWVEADKLAEGDRLRSDNGATVTFARSTVVPGTAYMWDLTISGTHDFYVSTATATILVHNNNCELPPGYKSFTAAKRDLGSPGEGNVFDHVVEQSQIKPTRAGFPAEDIHNPYNLNPVSAATNQIKANYYSSIKEFSGGSTVRDWLSTQSFKDQYSFGMETLALSPKA